MIRSPDNQRVLKAVSIFCGCISLFASSAVAADGTGIRYGNHHQGSSIGQIRSHGALGKVIPRQHSSSSFPAQPRHDYNNYRHYRYYSPSRYRSYTNPDRRYNNQPHQPYLDSRFPNSYRNYYYYQQSQARRYGSRNNYPANAWETLAQGQVNIALRQFSDETRAYPKAGISKVGYALSSAASGDLRQGIVAMRRAFRIDPVALRYYRIDQQLYSMTNDLIAKYQYKLNRRSQHRDEAFMVAALNYLNSDYSNAYEALERAKRDGDRSHSLRNLQDFLLETQYSTGP